VPETLVGVELSVPESTFLGVSSVVAGSGLCKFYTKCSCLKFYRMSSVTEDNYGLDTDRSFKDRFDPITYIGLAF
jgi:hypothetical protein